MKRYILLFGLVTWALCSCQDPSTNGNEGLGEVKISFTVNKGAEPDLMRGWLLLHSFEYEDARTAFRTAQERDPYAPMAYWGEAMSYHYTLWDREDYDQAEMALQKWQDMSAESEVSASELENDLMSAASVLFGSGSRIERKQAYAKAMEGIHDQYPANHEVAAIYALSLLGSVPEGRDFEIYGKAASIANGILAENPNHPGALHYLIHSYDDPEHAHLALDAANSYAQVAPDAAHALHMPSHIFVARGMWDEVISSNFASYYASVDRMERLEMNNNARSYHALAWLMYGLLQHNRLKEVDQIMEDMTRYAQETPSIPARAYLVGMIGTYAVFTQDWESPFLHEEVETGDLRASLQAIEAFTQGYRAFFQNDRETLKASIQDIKAARTRAQNSLVEGATSSCGTPANGLSPTQIDINVAGVIQLELEALVATLETDIQLAEQKLSEAVRLESETDYEYGPPTIVKPAHELYADWLMEQGRPQEAIAHYDLAEQRTPNRRLVLEGKQQATAFFSPEESDKLLHALSAFSPKKPYRISYFSR